MSQCGLVSLVNNLLVVCTLDFDVYIGQLKESFHLRPYQAKSTASRPICKVKLLRASLVLWWGTTWESEVP